MNLLLDASWGARFWEAFIGELKNVFGGIYTGSVNIGDEIREAILQWKGYLSIGGNRIPITDAIIISWIAAFFGILIFSTLGRKREIHPKGGQALMESLIGLLSLDCLRGTPKR